MSPGMVGAIAPSGPALSRLMVEEAEISRAESILELGPGTGVVTREILERRRPGSRLLLLERNEEFADHLQQQGWDAHVCNGCATELDTHLEAAGLDSVDAVVSGLPWAIFPEALQSRILEQVRRALAENGTFVTFAYFGPHWTPAGRRFRGLLESRFDQVRKSPVVLRNFPPAFVYRCR